MTKRNLAYGYCEEHRKRRYFSRKDARRAIRYWGATGTREYRCTLFEGWHVGHLPPVVRAGTKTAREVYEHEPSKRRGTAVNTAIPSSLTVHFVDPEADASVFPNCVVRPIAGFLFVTDLTAPGEKEIIFPAQTIDYAVREAL